MTQKLKKKTTKQGHLGRHRGESQKDCWILTWTLWLRKGLSPSLSPRSCLSQWDKDLRQPISNTLKRLEPINLPGDTSCGGIARLIPDGVLNLDRIPPLLPFHPFTQRKRHIPVSQQAQPAGCWWKPNLLFYEPASPTPSWNHFNIQQTLLFDDSLNREQTDADGVIPALLSLCSYN